MDIEKVLTVKVGQFPTQRNTVTTKYDTEFSDFEMQEGTRVVDCVYLISTGDASFII